MSAVPTRAEAEELLFREGLLLDTREWDAWLDLYLPDATFWMPAWRDEGEPTQDPHSELSLIFYEGRANLEERVWRARSGLSVASTPLPRTSHLVGNVLVEADGTVAASFTVNTYDVRARRSHAFFGRYRYRFTATPEGWRIAAKTIILINDTIPTVVDFYMI